MLYLFTFVQYTKNSLLALVHAFLLDIQLNIMLINVLISTPTKYLSQHMVFVETVFPYKQFGSPPSEIPTWPCLTNAKGDPPITPTNESYTTSHLDVSPMSTYIPTHIPNPCTPSSQPCDIIPSSPIRDAPLSPPTRFDHQSLPYHPIQS